MTLCLSNNEESHQVHSRMDLLSNKFAISINEALFMGLASLMVFILLVLDKKLLVLDKKQSKELIRFEEWYFEQQQL
jgi:hypothetical protein